MDAKSFALSEQSETLYLQMLNDKDSVVWAEKYPIEKGIAEGHVYIDTKLSEGNYRLGTIPATHIIMIRPEYLRNVKSG